jgi:hypothetical protein
MAPWSIITGSGLDDLIYYRFLCAIFCSHTITHNLKPNASSSTAEDWPRFRPRSTSDFWVKVKVMLWVTNGQSASLSWNKAPWLTSESESYITTDGQSASLSRNKAPDFYYCQTYRQSVRMRIGFKWLRIVSNGDLMWTFGFRRRR